MLRYVNVHGLLTLYHEIGAQLYMIKLYNLIYDTLPQDQ